MTTMRDTLAINTIFEAIDSIKDARDWHYAKGMIDMAFTLNEIDHKERDVLSASADRALRKVGYRGVRMNLPT